MQEIDSNTIMMVGVGVFVVQSMIIAYLWLLVNRKNNDELEWKIAKTAENCQLSSREADVLKEILDGKSNKEVADILFISENTVKVHRQKIYKKLNVNSAGALHRIIRETVVKEEFRK